VAGSVLAVTTNGRVRATLTRVAAQKDMTFTSLNGDVDVTLPPSTKANLRLRSDHGDVYSDFDVQLRPASQPAIQENTQGGGRYRVVRTRSVVGTIKGGGPEFELRTFNSNVYVRKGRGELASRCLKADVDRKLKWGHEAKWSDLCNGLRAWISALLLEVRSRHFWQSVSYWQPAAAATTAP
jgi:hypothetical protein